MATHVGDIPIIFGDPRQPKALPLSHPKARWQGFKTETTILKKGYRRRAGCLELPCDIVYERDTPVLLRDGVRIYVDVYRPVKGTAPAIVAWSPYGKHGGKGNQVLDDFPFRMGVPLHKLSELQKWEGPDPAYWVKHGYAIVNPDPRGVGKSEGNIYQFGGQEGRDGADVIDWAGQQEWCNGKVATSGNSWLSISSWFIAAERPKHLAAIAPWEGLTDMAGEGARGGVQSKPGMTFNLQLLQVNAGENSWENPIAMLKEYKTANAYSVDKAARVEDIEVPAYVVASWTNPIHTYGTFRGYCRLKSDKWLRVHDSWEWPDYYDDANQADLLKFFDRYLKDIDNGWEQTPRVRAKILDTASPLPLTGQDLVATAFPLPQAKARRLYIDGRMLSETPASPSALHYKASSVGLKLEYKFDQDTILCGPVGVHLSVTLTGEDSDIFVVFQKVLKSGKTGSQLKIPYERSWQTFAIRTANQLGIVPEAGFLFYQGPTGQIRVSRRAMNEAVPGFPVSDLIELQPVSAGQKVQVNIPVTPIGMKFAAGELLRVFVQGKDPAIYPPVDQGTLTVDGDDDLNQEVSVTVHTEDSFIELPIVCDGQ